MLYTVKMISLPKEMLDAYLQRRQADIEVLKKSIQLDSVADFNRIGHQLLGNARNFGFYTLEPIAAKLESLKKENLREQGPSIINEFSEWLTQALNS